MDYKTRTNNNVFVRALIILIIFIINPLISACYSIANLSKTVEKKQHKLLFFFISLFFGILAYTQTTQVGDIYRVYQDLVGEIFYWGVFNVESLTHPVFSLVSIFVAKLTGNIQCVSFFWITLVYFSLFCGTRNILDYKNINDSRLLMQHVIISVICFVFFVQATELMKQAIVTSLFYYAYSCFLQKRYIRTAIVVLFCLGIHLSILFYIPLFLATSINVKVLVGLFAISFLFRSFDFMAGLANITGGITELEAINSAAEFYSGNLSNFFSSSALTFRILFWLLVLMALVVAFDRRYEDKNLAKVCFLLLIILNLNYANNHNYTRILSLSYPFYCMLVVEFLIQKRRSARIFLLLCASAALVVHVNFTHARTLPNSYSTSYMGNSVGRILISPAPSYLNETNMSRQFPVR